jgi:hypothetical protein
MKVLSLLQPWATLVILGQKKLECRSWQTAYRGPLLIHASLKRPSRREKVFFEQSDFFIDHIKNMDTLSYGCIIGHVSLMEIYATGYLIQHPELFPNLNWQQEFAFDDFTPGRFAWVFTHPQPLSFPLPVKGMLGLWEYNGILG